MEALVELTEGDERASRRIPARALESPARQIAENSEVHPNIVVERITSGSRGYGFDVATGSYGDLIEADTIDPADRL